MHIVHAPRDLPETVTKSIFLAGPSPRSAETVGWRPRALAILEEIGYDGCVYLPEPEGGWLHSYDEQIEWEVAMRERADVIVFWVPRDMAVMPALTTNIEFGEDLWRGRTLYGRPEGAPSTRYLDRRYREATGQEPHADLAALLAEAVAAIAQGAPRTGGCRDVPLHVWNSPQFKAWHAAQEAAGNRLDGFRVLHAAPMGPRHPARPLFAWLARADVWVSREGRSKSNEFFFSRTDVASVIPIHRGPDGARVVLTREFRTPVRNAEGTVVEPPGGSSADPAADGRLVAVEELGEELGLAVDPGRLVAIARRQVAATVSSHHADVFALELDDAEMAILETRAAAGTVLGADAGERITLEIRRLDDLDASALDWASLGMVMNAAARLRLR